MYLFIYLINGAYSLLRSFEHKNNFAQIFRLYSTSNLCEMNVISTLKQVNHKNRKKMIEVGGSFALRFDR